MKKDVKFSIIVPAYNVEKYIDKTIQSVEEQNYKNWEMIIVDDGSSDNTLNRIDAYKNKNIVCIEADHGGVSMARNIGLDYASGDYIMFLDSDDYLEPWTLEYLNNSIQKNGAVDAFIGMFNSREENGLKGCHSEVLNPSRVNGKSQEEVLEYLYDIRMVFTVWRFVVSRELIEKNNLYFKENILHEDEDWVTRMLICSNSFRAIDKPFYNYRIRNGSIMTTKNPEHERLRHDSRYKIAMDFWDMANKDGRPYIRDFLYRCAYKNVQQIYADIRKQSNPRVPIEIEKM